MLRRLLLLLVLVVAAAAPATASACGGGYAYAGLFTEDAVAGVAATLSPTGPAVVADGHVAAWVNVGVRNAWLQVGINATATGGDHTLYYEFLVPGGTQPTYVALRSVRTGESVRVSIAEVDGQPGVWQVSVDGFSVAPPVSLRGSHGRWRGSVAAEAFSRGAGACDGFGYSFRDVGVLARSHWSAAPLVAAADPGYRVVRRGATAFDAATV